MLVHAHGFALSRGIADHVHVELDVRGGLPAFAVVGLGAAAARDARERVHAAVLNSGFALPRKRVTANLAPPVSARGAPAFDLVLACCVLAAQDELDAARLARIGLFAELGLGGDLRSCQGVTAAAEAAGEAGLGGLIVARRDLAEARESRALPVAGLSSLRVVAELLRAPRNGPRRRRGGASAVDGSAGTPSGKSPRTGAPNANASRRETQRTSRVDAPAVARKPSARAPVRASPPTATGRAPDTATAVSARPWSAAASGPSTNGARGQ